MTATSVINLGATTKSEAIAFADKLVAEVLDGNTAALEMHVKLTAMEKAIKDVKERIAAAVLDEATKHGDKTFDAYTAEITISDSLGAKYDYSACNDSTWRDLKANEERVSNERKAREVFLKSLKKPLTIANDETGEIETINPPVKSSTTGIKVTLK